MALYEHQKRFIARDPDKALLRWDTGVGKTLAACWWLKMRPELKALVICPKSIADKWKRDLKAAGAKADIITQDNLHKVDMARYKAVVVDEAHGFASPLFLAGRSKRSTILYQFVRNHPKANILLLSATPVRSSPWNAHTLACLLGIYWDKNDFQKEFFVLVRRFGRTFYEEKKDWRIRIRPYIDSISDTVLLKDCTDIPPQEEEVVHIKMKAPQSPDWHVRHRAEQGTEKTRALREILDGYQKAIVVCYYREQIDRYQMEFSDRNVFVLHGGVTDQDAVIEAAKAASDCVFIMQASMTSGFDASEFSVMIFASQSWKFVDNIQAKGRILRINNLHANKYVYLLAGACDNTVYETVKAGHDFHPPTYYKGDASSAGATTGTA